MSATTPHESSEKRSVSRNHSRSRPTTPLRPSSRSSLRESASKASVSKAPLEAFEPQFAELSDSMADLDANFMHLQIMNESLARFSENFASFLYGLNMNAFCVDFPEAPIPDSFKRAQQQEQFGRSTGSEKFQAGDNFDAETTFMTTDTSFVENPPQSTKNTSKFSTPAKSSRTATGSSRGGIPTARGRGGGIPRGTRGSGIGMGRGRGVR